MRWRVAGFAALCLFVSSVATRGEDADRRVAIVLTAEEKAFVLGQMRLFVESIERIVSSLAAGDRTTAAEAAAARGGKRFQAENVMPATLGAKFPEMWRSFGQPMRKGFDELADGLAQGEPESRALARLGETMRNCVSCHQSYRIIDARD
ncbi:hypothetical protein MSC49_33150 [Methylosinus sp. C49]|uniref:hypothetical protein n=1 Tax=Methylosinus sp. C49 TaxID=2699395 RepID=UPI0013673789|nr:hypothetical protein [Methylosinus sp. C49]BBU63380.1 hypothetical protein MSC49_33150 [Methylosinus sp. C49]